MRWRVLCLAAGAAFVLSVAGCGGERSGLPTEREGVNGPGAADEAPDSESGQSDRYRDVPLDALQRRTPPVEEDRPSEMPRPEEGPPPSQAGDRGTTQGGSRAGATVQRTIPGTAVEYTMVYVPGGPVTMEDDAGEPTTVEVGGFWIGRTELTWDEYDVFVFNLDQPGENAEADAVSRPSRPYIPPDRGFGHGGYPAISMTTQGAVKYCAWLSAKTGRHYRLPTVAEWRRAALMGAEGPFSYGADAEESDAYAWTQSNSPEKTQPVAQKKPNELGLYDVEGNVMEWCRSGEGFVACGGSYMQEPADASSLATAEQTWEWNMTDPQIPKSPWWLSDASWVGMRIVCDDETTGGRR